MQFFIISASTRSMAFLCLFFSFFLVFGTKQAKAQINVQIDEYHQNRVKLAGNDIQNPVFASFTPTEIRLTSLMPLAQTAQICIIDCAGNCVFQSEWKSNLSTFESVWKAAPSQVYYLYVTTEKHKQTLAFSIIP